MLESTEKQTVGLPFIMDLLTVGKSKEEWQLYSLKI